MTEAVAETVAEAVADVVKVNRLTDTQRAFATSKDPFPAFVGGYGSGKSAAAIARAMALKAHFRQNDIAYYLPTYPLVEDIAFKRFPELCERKGWAYKLHRGNSPGISFPNAGKIVFRTMENPDRIVGYEVAHSLVDEIDTLATDKARLVWARIIARNRQKMIGGQMRNTVGVATTPEGFKFVYERWEKNPKPGYVLYRAKTMDNVANLPEGYIENLMATYTGPQLAAYLEGLFVNLTSGTVYTDFDRRVNFTAATVKDGEALHIGMDFNVGKMAAIVHVIREGKPYAVDEILQVLDTPAMIVEIRKRYPKETHPSILVYPDASGQARKSNNASQSDLSLLRGGGFHVCVNNVNPAVKDRVLSMNKVFRDATYRVNPDKCPVYTECLEKQAYDKNGEPSKESDLDHPNDAGGYFITYKYPVAKRIVIADTDFAFA